MKIFKNILSKVKWWHTFLFLILLFCSLLYSIYRFNLLGLLGTIPDNPELKMLKIPVISEVYTEDSVLICEFYKEKRKFTLWGEIPPVFLKGLISVEDIRFYEHEGVDWQSNFSILWYFIKGNKRGGSTITQQLVKNVFDSRNPENFGILHVIPGLKLLAIKFTEWNIATRLEKIYTKDEILHLYINAVDFGGNHFGLKTAAEYFYNKSPSELTVDECAVLIGVLKAPTTYHPILHPKACKERRNTVLQILKNHNIINEAEFTSYSKLEVTTNPTKEQVTDYKDIYLKLALEKEANIWCRKNNYNLYTDGLIIYTTIHSKIQNHAKSAVKEHMTNIQRKFFKHWEGELPWINSKKEVIGNFLEEEIRKTNRYKSLKRKYGNDTSTIRKILNQPKKIKVFTWSGIKDTVLSSYDSLKYYKMFLQAGFISIDPSTGYVKSWIGSNDYRYFKYDHINQSKRQPGSTFKPFVYATAIENGLTPCDTLVDKMIIYRYEEDGEKKIWIPKNADRVYTNDTLTLRFAMGRSINSIAAQLSIKYTADSVMEMAKRLGIKSELKPVPSAGLGSNEVNLAELTSSYTAFMNKGKRNSPILIYTIHDKNKNKIHTSLPLNKKVLSEETAWIMSYMLRGTLEEPNGTSQALFQNGTITHKNHIGGKTGTSSNYADGWYVGVTKNLIAGVWVGADDQSIHFRTSTLGEGMKTALPIFGKFMQKVYADSTTGITKSYFAPPLKE